MCAVIMDAIGEGEEARALKGTSSVSRSSSNDLLMTGRERCESTYVSPCPGKCFAQGAIPSQASADATVVANVLTTFGSARNTMIILRVHLRKHLTHLHRKSGRRSPGCGDLS